MQAKRKAGCFFLFGFVFVYLFLCLVCFFWLGNIKTWLCISKFRILSLSAAEAPLLPSALLNAQLPRCLDRLGSNEYGPSLPMSVHMVMSVHVGEPVLV